MMQIDRDKCIRAMCNIYIGGCPDRAVGGRGSDGPKERHRVIEEAIIAIQQDGESALMGGFLGVKNYAAFGDQRCDCSYGMGPSHGSIVFRIGRTQDSRKKSIAIGDDEIYLLEAVRDFGSCPDPEHSGASPGQPGRNFNLCDVIVRLEKAERLAKTLAGLIEDAEMWASLATD